MKKNPLLKAEEVGNPGCGAGTPNACFALALGPMGFECSMISNPLVAYRAGIQLGWRVNVDRKDKKRRAWCPKGVLKNSKKPKIL